MRRNTGWLRSTVIHETLFSPLFFSPVYNRATTMRAHRLCLIPDEITYGQIRRYPRISEIHLRAPIFKLARPRPGRIFLAERTTASRGNPRIRRKSTCGTSKRVDTSVKTAGSKSVSAVRAILSIFFDPLAHPVGVFPDAIDLVRGPLSAAYLPLPRIPSRDTLSFTKHRNIDAIKSIFA